MARKEIIEIEARLTGALAEIEKLKSSLKETKVEAKKTSKEIDDVASNGGAIAILDQLTGGLATSFKDAYEASKLFNISLKATKGALLATGIGAFVVVLGTVVAYWDEIKDFITGSNTELEEQIKLTSLLGDYEQRNVDLLNSQDNTLKLQGKTQKEINNLKIEALKILIEQRKEEATLAKQRLEELVNIQEAGGSTLESLARGYVNFFTSIYKQIDGLFSKIGIDLGLEGGMKSTQEWVFEGLFGTDEDIEAAKKRLEELEAEIIGAQNTIDGLTLSNFSIDTKKEDKKETKTGDITLDERRAALQEIEDLENEYFISRKEQEEQEEIAIREKYFTAIERAKEFGEETFILEEAQQTALQELKDKYIAISQAKDEKARQEAIRSKKAETDALKAIQDTQFDNLASGISLVASLDAKSKKLQAGAIIAENAAGIAKNIINTNAANARLTLETGIAAPAAILANNVRMGIGIAASIAATAKGLSALGGGGSAGGASAASASASTGAASAPSFNLVQGTGTNQIAESINASGNRPIEAFVVSSSVTTAQELDHQIVQSSTI